MVNTVWQPGLLFSRECIGCLCMGFVYLSSAQAITRTCTLQSQSSARVSGRRHGAEATGSLISRLSSQGRAWRQGYWAASLGLYTASENGSWYPIVPLP